eukprot:CAMPEP_0113938026 /NCGR_PEP_ID=MMETSP1339-20121228/4462_1 /TAXON_ID=94617 /ORGANISM="Fibrocapsa japonica" /LENGTH=348 /DNA_ID=CAMNT_0000940957 /DNA_START=63 /DNA_END=1109 /DNA_ORIENTATION=+ /assembly_acc=CAM_ASM_000762
MITISLLAILFIRCGAFVIQQPVRRGSGLFVPSRGFLEQKGAYVGQVDKLFWTTVASGEFLQDGSSPASDDSGNGITQTTADVMSLNSIRRTLIRQEETIIFAMIERAQYLQNNRNYESGPYKLIPEGLDGAKERTQASFLEYFLFETEKLHARVRRYTSPEEYPFFADMIPPPILPLLNFPHLLQPHSVNLNHVILKRYVDEVVPRICSAGDDEQYGSTALADITALQALSRRIHYGLFVAESKFLDNPSQYEALVRAGDAKGVYDLLTNASVEELVLQRAFRKASTYGQDITATGDPETTEYKVEPRIIRGLYKSVIIPLTKEVEVLYLFERVGCPCPDLSGIHDS